MSSGYVTMKATIQIGVEITEAEKFVRQMETQGYEVGREQSKIGHKTDIHFKLDGKTHLHYAVTIDHDGERAWIGIRPQ